MGWGVLGVEPEFKTLSEQTSGSRVVTEGGCSPESCSTAVMRSRTEIELKSLILAQIERWRHALHMQVERERGGNSPSRVANG